MGIRGRTNFDKIGILFLILTATMFFSGCMESKASASDEINTSLSLINSAESRIGTVRSDIFAGTYTSAKINLNASRIDFEESLKILNNAASDSEEEIQEIERYKILADSGIDRVNSLESMIEAMEHMDKSLAYAESREFNLSRIELNKMNGDLNKFSISSNSAKEKIFLINLDSVPVEQKSSISLLRGEMESIEKMSMEIKEMMDGMYPYLDGVEYFFNATEYMKVNEWDKAADEFVNASVKFSESNNKLEKLKDSQYSEISVGAIEICGILDKMEENLPYFESGCRYMEEGRYFQAEKEFNKVSFI